MITGRVKAAPKECDVLFSGHGDDSPYLNSAPLSKDESVLIFEGNFSHILSIACVRFSDEME